MSTNTMARPARTTGQAFLAKLLDDLYETIDSQRMEIELLRIENATLRGELPDD